MVDPRYCIAPQSWGGWGAASSAYTCRRSDDTSGSAAACAASSAAPTSARQREGAGAQRPRQDHRLVDRQQRALVRLARPGRPATHRVRQRQAPLLGYRLLRRISGATVSVTVPRRPRNHAAGPPPCPPNPGGTRPAPLAPRDRGGGARVLPTPPRSAAAREGCQAPLPSLRASGLGGVPPELGGQGGGPAALDARPRRRSYCTYGSGGRSARGGEPDDECKEREP